MELIQDERVNQVLSKFKRLVKNSINAGKEEKALASISAAASLLYQYNQIYTDKDLEQMLLEIAQNSDTLQEMRKDLSVTKRNTVLFYDGFGLDIRGWALAYMRAFTKLDYEVYYVTSSKAIGTQPEIDQTISDSNVKKVVIDFQKGYVNWYHHLAEIFSETKPSVAFFYTTPNDVAATVVFDMLSGLVRRYQIDLTDHAYWLGVHAADFCLSSRSVGASIAVYHRGFDKEQIRVLDGCAIVHDDIPFQGFPFDLTAKKLIFSGGALYKTLGDKNNTFYRMVDYVLNHHDDVIFYYLGNGDQSKLQKLKHKYPRQVFFEKERKDFFEVMKRCTLYLNTYPMFGGLMMRYAAMAGKLPITLKHEHDADGILFHQEDLEIEYDDRDTLLKDVDRLLDDEEYRKKREKKMLGSTILEPDFRRNLKTLIDDNVTEYHLKIAPVDTERFRSEYLKRFNFDQVLMNSVANKMNGSLCTEFPILFIKKILAKICKR